MATTIITKNSSTTTAIPTAGVLVQGELAVNVTDKRLFTENASGDIVELGTAPSTIDINAGTIDGTVIGGTTAAAVSATTISATGNITVGGTVDGRDVATDGTKLDGLNQGVATTDSPTFVAVTSTNGIYLGGTSSSNLLSDYETGTWIPSISGGVVSTDGGNTYTKVGRLVTILMRFTVTTSSTFNFIAGLPFPADTGASKFQSAGMMHTSSGTGLVTARLFDNNSSIYVYDNSSGYTTHPLTTSRSNYTLSFSYTTTA